MSRQKTVVKTAITTIRIVSGEKEDEESADPGVEVTPHRIIPTATIHGIRTRVLRIPPEEISNAVVSGLSFRSLTEENRGRTGGHILRIVLRTTDGQNEISWHF